MESYILALDQGTTSSRAIIFNHDGQPIATAQKEFTQYFPQPGWVEHDPMEIWSTQLGVAAEAITQTGLTIQHIAAIGITNQRETTVVWNKHTGQPVYKAIVWQDRRTGDYCDSLHTNGWANRIQEKTGLIPDAYFSATKLRWILKNVAGAMEQAKAGDLCFGTVDSWLLWNLTRGKVHATDVSNASRTMLFNIHSLGWDDELLELFEIPKEVLPKVCSSSEVYGFTEHILTAKPVPIAGIAGDQQAALFGQLCTRPGMVKNTYGTGCFMLMNTGQKPVLSKHKLLTTVAWQIKGETHYALEGSVFMGGAVVQWLRDGLGLIRTAAEIEELALQVEDHGDVYLVPAFAGLGAPYWNPHARGTLVGMSRGTKAAHIARAALESICYQTTDVLKAMEADAGFPIAELRVDGGATVNNLLMQMQSNILRTTVIRPTITETTALGAAFLAGLAVGFWSNPSSIQDLWKSDKVFEPHENENRFQDMYAGWQKAVSTTLFQAGSGHT